MKKLKEWTTIGLFYETKIPCVDNLSPGESIRDLEFQLTKHEIDVEVLEKGRLGSNHKLTYWSSVLRTSSRRHLKTDDDTTTPTSKLGN